MATYDATIRTDWDLETTFSYLADFRTIVEWDPSIEWSRLIAAEPLTVGAAFELRMRSFGRRINLIYETVEIDPPNKVVLRADLGTMVSLDTLSFAPDPDSDGSLVEYHAELSLKGPLKLADPALQLIFNPLGDRARNGLAERLDGEAPRRLASRSEIPTEVA